MARKLVGSMGFSSKNPKNFSTDDSFFKTAIRYRRTAVSHGSPAER
jgi:hypothetical protein